MPKLKRRRPEAVVEREIATGAIVDTTFFQSARAMLNPDIFKTELLSSVWRWCENYYNHYGQMPGRDIESIFESHREEIEEPAVVEKFLRNISDEYEREGFNRWYVLDKAEQYATARNLEITEEALRNARTRGDLPAAEAAIADYKRPARPKTDAIDPWTNAEEIRAAFEEGQEDPLIRFPGEAGRFLNPKLIRSSLVGLLGPNKRGKSFWLQEFAIRACRLGRRVLYIDAGDMGRKRIIRRKHTRLAGRSMDPRDCGTVYVPVLDCVYNQANTCTADCRTCDIGLGGDEEMEPDPTDWPDGYEPCNRRLSGGCCDFRGAVLYDTQEIKKPLTWAEGLRRGERFKAATGFDYRLLCYSSGSITVAEIDQQLRILEEFDGFLADVVVVDYADILAPEDPRADKRDQVNDTWIAMRRLSQDWHNLVIAATQADAEAFNTRILQPRNFTNDRRKLDHVTSMIGLNQHGAEKRMGIMRLNELAAREEYFEITDTVSVLQCLEKGRPFLDSFRTHDVTAGGGEEDEE